VDFARVGDRGQVTAAFTAECLPVRTGAEAFEVLTEDGDQFGWARHWAGFAHRSMLELSFLPLLSGLAPRLARVQCRLL
jgi:hypothetical protein